MPKTVSDNFRDALTHVVREAMKNIGDVQPKKSSSPLSGPKGLAAGAGLAALAPLAKRGVDAVRANGGMPTPAKATRKVAYEGRNEGRRPRRQQGQGRREFQGR